MAAILLPPRDDLRQHEELRPMVVNFDIAPEAAASVMLCQGKTKVVVSVHGPAQPRVLRHEEYDRCTLEVECRANSNTNNKDMLENDCVLMTKKILEPAIMLEQFPRMLISLKVNILQDDGALITTILNASAMAICKSGIPMAYLPVSVSCVKSKDGHFLLDPSVNEELSSSSNFNFTINSSRSQNENLLSSSSNGCFSIADLKAAVDVCNRASALVEKAIKDALIKDMS